MKAQRIIPAFRNLCSYCIVLVFLCYGCGSDKPLNETERLAYLAKIWGLVKYYHPAVGTGAINWDSVLIAELELIKSSPSDEAFNEKLQKIIELPGIIPPSNHTADCDADSTELFVDFDWVNATSLSKANSDLLLNLIKNKAHFKNKYVSDSIGTRRVGYAKFYEEPMKEADLSKAEIKLLGLFRYWNAIEYFFPYKNLIEENWDSVLIQYIPRFLQADGIEQYYEEILQLSTEIKDGHANIPYHPDLRADFFGRMTVPFSVKFVENKLIVNRLKSDSLAALTNIQIGDEIIKIDGLAVEEKSQELGKYLSQPNDAFHKEEISTYILNGKTDSLALEIRREDKPLALKIKRYTFAEIRKFRNKNIEVAHWKILPSNIGYAHMGELTLDTLSHFFAAIKSTEALILDFRHYPKFEVLFEFLSYFYPENAPFALFKSQCIQQPGYYYWDTSLKNYAFEKPKGMLYTQPLVLLVDVNTLSLGEYFVMALQKLDNVTTIGSQTAGEDGNQVGLVLPGNITTFFSSLGIYYPDGSNTQRSGVRIDIYKKPTVEGVISGKDEVLNAALKYLKK